MNKPLWEPTELKKKSSILADFAKFINFKSEYNFKDLWKWTVEVSRNVPQWIAKWIFRIILSKWPT